MWPTVDGLRVLVAAEAQLLRRSVRWMFADITREAQQAAEQVEIGIDWFDQWDWDQRIWLLMRVTEALLTDADPPPPAAMWEATVDAIFGNVYDQIAAEIDGNAGDQDVVSWRQAAFDAFTSQHSRNPEIDPRETDLQAWRILVTKIADVILGTAVYQQAELLRDQNIRQSEAFLQRKGLPEDFLQQIPPLRTPLETETSMARLKRLVGE